MATRGRKSALWPLVAVIVAVALLTSAGSASVLASRGALPGTPMYSVKRQVVSLELALPRNSAGRASVQLMVAERRLDEVEQLASEGSEDLAEQTVNEYDSRVSSAAPPQR